MTKDVNRWIILLVVALVIAIVLIVVFITRPKEEMVVPENILMYEEKKSGEYDVEFSYTTEINISKAINTTENIYRK